jgi:hypothetical protein
MEWTFGNSRLGQGDGDVEEQLTHGGDILGTPVSSFGLRHSCEHRKHIEKNALGNLMNFAGLISRFILFYMYQKS